MRYKIVGVLVCMLLISSVFSSVVDAYNIKKIKTPITDLENNRTEKIEKNVNIDIIDENNRDYKSLLIKEKVFDSNTLTMNLEVTSLFNKRKYTSSINFLNGENQNKIKSFNNANVLNPAIEKGSDYYCLLYEFDHDSQKDIGIARRTESGNTWEDWYFDTDGAETIPDIDYWGSGKKFYATAKHSNKDFFYYIEIPDIADENSWVAHILDWSSLDYNFDFYDSTSVGCYEGEKAIFSVIGSTNYPGYECSYAPMIIYNTGGDDWTINWFTGLDSCSHISMDIDQSTGIIYLAFEKDNDIYLLSNDYDNGLSDSWSSWHIDEPYEMKYPDVSAVYGTVCMTAQAKCEGDWDPWFFCSNDNNILNYGWLLGTDADEMYPRVSLTYDGSHVIGNWIYTKNSALYSGPDDKVSGDYSADQHYRCCDVADGHASWTTPTQDAIVTNDIVIGGYTPVAYIDLISPNPADEGEKVNFIGYGWDPDGWATGYQWESDIDGFLSSEKQFSISALSAGTHTISFKVKDNNNKWSLETTKTLVIKGNNPPLACIDSIAPNPAFISMSVSFNGHGTDYDGTVIDYNWRSDIDGFLSSDFSFSTSSLSKGIHAIYFKVKDDDGKWSSEVSKQLQIIQPITFTKFKPCNAGTDNSYTSSYIDSDKDETDFPFDAFADIEVSANKSSGFIGASCIAASSDLGEANGWGESFQKVSFYTGSQKTVHISAVLYLIHSEIEIGIDTRGETKYGHMINNQKTWDKIIDEYFDWDYILSLILNIVSVFTGFIPSTILQAISYGTTIADYALLAQEFYDANNQGDAEKYIIDFDMTTSNGGDNFVGIGARFGIHTAWFGEINTGFIGLVDEIKVDGIAPPINPIVDYHSSGNHNEPINFDFTSVDPNNDNIKYIIDWGDESDIYSTDYYSSGKTVSITHIYDSPGTYSIEVYVKDKDNMESERNSFQITIGNGVPNKPSLSREKISVNNYFYYAVSTDPDGDQVTYFFEFDDGHTDQKSANSGQRVRVQYKNCKVRAKTKDEYGADSGWTEWKSLSKYSNNLDINSDFQYIYYYFPWLTRIISIINSK